MLEEGATLSVRWFQPKEVGANDSYAELTRFDPESKGRVYCVNNGEFSLYGKESETFGLTGATTLLATTVTIAAVMLAI